MKGNCVSGKSQSDTGLESAYTEGSLGKVNNLSVFQPILMGLGINGTETLNVSLRPFRQNKYELSGSDSLAQVHFFIATLSQQLFVRSLTSSVGRA